MISPLDVVNIRIGEAQGRDYVGGRCFLFNKPPAGGHWLRSVHISSSSDTIVPVVIKAAVTSEEERHAGFC